ncbi:MAG: hypothetical protein LPK14_01380 [Hymenobacteraceae bacterium]|nr:hypothetical protein [Hymenobacteraceae bacterium]
MAKEQATSLKSMLRVSGLVLAVGFLLNLIWENAQAPLYQEYRSFYESFSKCLLAAVIDALVTLLLYLLFALFYQNLYWLSSAGTRTYLLLLVLGALLAIWFEKWALLVGQWSYTEAMPVVTVLDVGLPPLLQLMFLPILSIWISTHLALRGLHHKR